MMRFLSSTDKFDDRIKGLSDYCSWSQDDEIMLVGR